MSEKGLWLWLRDGWSVLGRRVHAQRVETGTSTGVPDTEVCFDGVTAWFELKAAPEPASPDTPLRFKLSTAQALWHSRRAEAGGTSFIVVGVGAGRDKRIYVLHGATTNWAIYSGGLWTELPSSRGQRQFTATERALRAYAVAHGHLRPIEVLEAMTVPNNGEANG